MKKKKIWISGGFGFVGSNLVEALQDDYELTVYDGDVTQKIGIKNNFDIIYHLAANTDTTFPDNVEMYRNNILGFLEVLRFALQNKSKLIYASSGAVYGNNGLPLNIYGDSKRIIDEIAEEFYTKLNIIGLRFFNVYGTGELGKEKMASMITQWKEQVLDEKKPIIFKGEFKRDFVYIKDVIKALKQAMRLKSGIYDVGTGKATDFREVLEIVIKTLNSKVKPKFVKNPYLGKYQTFTKANLDWGFEPDYNIKSGIKDYFETCIQ